MQLQLSMAVADKLHEALLVRGESLDAVEAACLLVASPSCPPSLGLQVLETLIRNDHRFCLVGENSQGKVPSASQTGCGRVSLSHWEMPDPDLADVPFVALDLETTGARPGTSKITEIGAVRYERFQEVGQFHTLVNPMRPIPPMITQITGITAEMVADAPRIDEVIPDLLEFLKGAIVVAHNASFDVGFLNYELRRLKGRQLGEGALDTLPLSRALAPGLPNYRLGTVAEALGAPVNACHRALADAQAAGHVFVTLIGRLQEQGFTHLSEARAYASPHSRSGVEKLWLTRDIPRTPGAYHFVDKDGRILYVGKADRLREHVRSYFVASATPARKVRQAVRLVERIDWDETYTPLEAVVKEQELILEHRPPCNLHGSRPENYVYLKIADSRMGLSLLTTTRGPRPNGAENGGRGSRSKGAFLLGPFRGRSRLANALDLLQKIYPIRRCARRTESRPCVRGDTGRCLAPCGCDPAVRREHDALVDGIIRWLVADGATTIPDPRGRVEDLAQNLSRQRRFEDAQKVRDAWDDLLSIRRSYASLVEAQALCFASMSPLDIGNGAPQLRMNVVWKGRLLQQVSLCRDNLNEGVDAALAAISDDESPDRPSKGTHDLVAVPQEELDVVLAVRRWFMEADKPALIMLNGNPDDGLQAQLHRWRRQLLAEALNIF